MMYWDLLNSTLSYIVVAFASLLAGIAIGRSKKIGRIIGAMHELRGKSEGQDDRP